MRLNQSIRLNRFRLDRPAYIGCGYCILAEIRSADDDVVITAAVTQCGIPDWLADAAKRCV